MPALRTVLALALVLLTPLCRAEDLGVVGPLYPITEPDLLETIHARLRSLEAQGELARLEATARERMRAYAERPEGVRLPRAAWCAIAWLEGSWYRRLYGTWPLPRMVEVARHE